MSELNINDFDFESMSNAIGSNPFEKEKSYTDERFYKLDKDKNGNGQAIIALVPDKNKRFIIRMYKIETTLMINGNKQWINEWSPRSIGKPCPFHETYINHWNEDKETAKQFKTKEKWICNVKIIKDNAHPENEGKIFLYAFSKSMAEKIQSTINLSETEIAMGMQRKEIFNPLKGWVMNLKCYKGDNGFINYDNSEFMQLPNGNTIYGALSEETKQKCIKDILENTYDLAELQKPENFLSYDELHKELERICRGTFGIGNNAKSVQSPLQSTEITIETPKAEEPLKAEVVSTPKQDTKKDDLSDFLNSL